MENNFYVYVYFDPSRDFEAFYIGKGKDNRSHCHLTRTDKHPFTQRLQKMAREGIIPIIERYERLSEKAAFDLERVLIKEIGRKDLGNGTLLNLSEGGEGPSGQIQSIETRLKRSEAQRNRSPEEKAKTSKKISEVLLSKSPEEKAKVYEKVSNSLLNKSSEEKNEIGRKKKETMFNNPHKEMERRKKISETTRGVKHNLVQCPHCLKIGGQSTMKQWHFDKCRKQPTYQNL